MLNGKCLTKLPIWPMAPRHPNHCCCVHLPLRPPEIKLASHLAEREIHQNSWGNHGKKTKIDGLDEIQDEIVL